jgi:ferredoxin--NADP+ reductase/benzoate/toluate 1,2-dioxygenase reductase subunit
VIETSRRLPSAASRAARVHRVLQVRDLSPSAFLLRLTRDGMSFRAGQWINIGLPGSRDQREYSVYSSPEEDFLEVLVKEIPDGTVSGALRRRQAGDALEVDGPHGSFCLVEGRREKPRFLFLATGTGISPFHSMVKGTAGLDYLLLHGVRSAEERYEHAVFDPARLVPCISRSADGAAAYRGRITAYLAEHPVEADRYCYLCGNSDMIYEAYALLRAAGVHSSRIFAEVYF